MDRIAPRNEQPGLPALTHPVVRAAVEFHLHGFDVLLSKDEQAVIQDFIFLAVLHDRLQSPPRRPTRIRGLALRFALPYATVHRSAKRLIDDGRCVRTSEGLAPSATALRSASVRHMLRGTYGCGQRLLANLRRIGFIEETFALSMEAPSDRLTPRQKAFAVLAMGRLLGGASTIARMLRIDPLKSTIFAAILSANIKHVINSPAIVTKGILPDSMRRPVSVLALSRSLRLPYETTRRQTGKLIEMGLCERRGRDGVIIPEHALLAIQDVQLRIYGVINELVDEMRRLDAQRGHGKRGERFATRPGVRSEVPAVDARGPRRRRTDRLGDR